MFSLYVMCYVILLYVFSGQGPETSGVQEKQICILSDDRCQAGPDAEVSPMSG